jgi:hypothetical protein
MRRMQFRLSRAQNDNAVLPPRKEFDPRSHRRRKSEGRRCRRERKMIKVLSLDYEVLHFFSVVRIRGIRMVRFWRPEFSETRRSRRMRSKRDE